MPVNCILPRQAEKLKEAFQKGKISIAKLYTAGSSAKRIKILKPYVGQAAKEVNAKIEKLYLVPNQKAAVRNFLFKEVAQVKPLYANVSIKEAQKMSENIDIISFKKLGSAEARIEELSKYVDQKKAKDLNNKFERLEKTGNIKVWEEKTLGTEKLRTSAKLKGSLAKLEVLDDMGLLSPRQLEQFMQSFIETKLGVDIDIDQSKKLSELVKKQKESYDGLMQSKDWTANNEKAVMEYFDIRKELEDYAESLMPRTKSNFVNDIVDVFRANILASPRILRNSFLYQALPAVERTITKRLVSGNFNSEDLKSNFAEKMIAKLSGVKPNTADMNFIKRQTAMAIKIYHKTGYDISRMENISDGYRYFGEEASKPKWVGFKILNLAPKWLAGGTDTLFANIGRADTANIMSKEIAKMEALKGKLPKGMTQEQRASQLLKESYSFVSTDPQAIKIRSQGIMDAHIMNSTQEDGLSNLVIKARRGMKMGKINFGKVIIPFAKIPATTISIGAKTATGYGIVRSLVKIQHATRQINVARRSEMMGSAVNDLVRYATLMGAAILVAASLDDDDYIGAWDTLKANEYKLAQARGGGTNYIRIGGKWIPLRYLTLINIPISAIMTARQTKARGGNYALGYVSGLVGQIMDMPGVSEVGNIYNRIGRAMRSDKTMEEFLSAMGLDPEGLMNWGKVRLLPSVLTYDVYNAIIQPPSKFDFLGREIEHGGMFKKDKTNDVLIEFSRLQTAGYMPTISEPTGTTVEKYVEKRGQEAYDKKIIELKQIYAEKVSNLIRRGKYKNWSNEKKKKEVDKLRQEQIYDKLRQLH